MAIFDKRHKWGDAVRDGVLLSRTCRVCGRTETYETFIPDAFLDALMEHLGKPNPYRALFPVRL